MTDESRPQRSVDANDANEVAGGSDATAGGGDALAGGTDGTARPAGRTGADGDGRETATFGLDARLASGFSYSMTFLSGLAFYLVSDDERVRFHAARSLVVFGGLFGLNVLLSALRAPVAAALGPDAAAVLGAVSDALLVLAFGLWLVLMVAAFRERQVSIPYVDDAVAALAGARA